VWWLACGLVVTTPVAAQPASVPALAWPLAVAMQADNTPLGRQEIRARLSPRRYTTLASEIGAKVNRMPVLEGGTFRVGQLLVASDCSIQQAQMQKARAEQAGAERSLEANVALEKLNSVGQLELDLSKTAVQRAQAEVNLHRAMLEKCSIHAPYGGRVAEQKVREQQFVQAGQPLLDLIDDSVLELEFIVPSRWLAWIKPGEGFKIAIDETGRSYPARFTRIGARIDPVSQSVKVNAAIEGRHPELVSGMSGRVDIAIPAGSH
jgi:RND family efflux transporter MFP subunit